MSTKVILTGGHGFLGKRVRALLEARDIDTVIPVRPEYDLRFQDDVSKLFFDATANGQVDCVIHLAATVGGIGATASSPADFMYDNLIMGTNLIRQAHICGIEKVVLIGSVCSYPKNTPMPLNESNLWEGYPEENNAPYGISKRALGALLMAHRKQYSMQGAYLVLANLYGPGDNFNLETSHVIPALIQKFHQAKKNDDPSVTVWGTGRPSRDFLYVGDAAEAVIMAMDRITHPIPINIGTGREITISWLALKIAKLIGYKGDILFDSTKPDGQPRRCVDIARARQMLRWEPQMDFENGLEATVSWFLERENETI